MLLATNLLVLINSHNIYWRRVLKWMNLSTVAENSTILLFAVYISKSIWYTTQIRSGWETNGLNCDKLLVKRLVFKSVHLFFIYSLVDTFDTLIFHSSNSRS